VSSELVNGLIAVGVLVVMSVALYRPRVQASIGYQATVVPLANIMDVGFIMMSPIIVVLIGYTAPLFMLALCLLAIANGFAISYNIRHYEPLIGTKDPANAIAAVAKWALFGASVVNIAYYAQLMMSLVLSPLGIYTPDRVTAAAVVILLSVAVIGYRWGLGSLNRIGDKTTAFNISAVFAILAAFVAYNIQEAVAGRWDLAAYDPPVDATTFRQLIGFFAIVQGFEASRYLGKQFSAKVRISTMRRAQYIASIAFITLLASTLLLYSQVRPNADATAVFALSGHVSAFLPWLLLVAAIGSQLSAIVNASSSRSDLLIEATHESIPRKYTFLILLIPASLIVVFTSVTDAVAVASRVFAGYFAIQATLAGFLAVRGRSWLAVAGFAVIGLVMAFIMIFGLSV
jgi:hypothetical protein